MTKDANFAFMSRHLLMSELDGQLQDIPGGVLALGQEAWLGLWDAEAAGDPEAATGERGTFSHIES